MAGITVPIDGDLSPILKTFGELPGRTQAEMAAVGAVIERDAKRGAIAKGFAEIEGVSAASAKRAANAVIREMERAAQETKRVNEAAAAAAAAAAREAERKMAQLARESAAKQAIVKQGLSATFGGVVNDLDDLDGMLSQVGTSGAATFGAIGLAVTGLGALVVAEVGAISGMVAIMYELADSTGQLNDEKVILESSISHLSQTVGMLFVPEFESAITAVAGLVIGVEQLIPKIVSLGDQFESALQSSTDFRMAMALVTGGTTEQFLATRELARAREKQGIVEGSLADQARDRAKAETDAAAAVKKAQDAASKSLDDARRAETERSRAEDQAAAEAKRKREEAARQVESDTKALNQIIFEGQRSLLEGEDAIDQAYLDKLDRIAQLEETSGDHAAAEKARAVEKLKWEQNLAKWQEGEDKKKADTDKKAADEKSKNDAEARKKAEENEKLRIEAAKDLADSQVKTALLAVDGVSAVTQTIIDLAENGTKAQKEAAMVAFRVNQSASLAQVAINTAVAITEALKTPGLGPIQAAAYAAIGLTQAATIAAQPAPTFHTGGIISSSPLAPDETMIRARKGEEIRTRQEQSGGAGVTVQMVYQHRVFDTFVADNLKQTGSPLRREIGSSSGRLLGHRERAR